MKSLFLICFVILFTIDAIAQSASDLNKKGEEFYKAGKYSEAEALFNKALNQTNATSLEYAASCNGLGKICVKSAHYSRADSLFAEAYRIRIKNTGEQSLELAETMNNWASLKMGLQQFDSVPVFFMKSLEIRKSKLNDKHPDYAESLCNMGYFYMLAGYPDRATDMLTAAENIRAENFGEISMEYANSMIIRAYYYIYKEDYASAEKYAQKYMDICAQERGKQHFEYVQGLICLSNIALQSGRYMEMKHLALQTLEIVKETPGINSFEYVAASSNLSTAYFKTGSYQKAEAMFRETLRSIEQIVGTKHSWYANIMNNFASFYQETGDYANAERYFLQSLDLKKQLYGESNPNVALSLNNLSSFYYSIHNKAASKKVATEAKTILDASSREATPLYAHVLNNLAHACESKNEAFGLLKQSAEIFKKNFGEDSSDYLIALSNIAKWLQLDKDMDKAATEEFTLDLLQKQKSTFGEDSPTYLISLNALAIFYDRIGKHNKAAELYDRVTDGAKRISPENKIYFSALLSEGTNACITDNYSKAKACYDEALELTRKQAWQNFSFLADKERELFWNFINYSDFYHTFSNKYKDKDMSAAAFAYDCELLSKSLLLNSSSQVRNSIQNSNDTLTISLWETITALKQQALKLETQAGSLAKNVPQSSDSVKRLREEIENIYDEITYIEKTVMTGSVKYADQQKDFTIRWTDIQQALETKSAAVEFIKFKNITQLDTDSLETLYAALVLRSGYSYPVLVTLCNESALADAISRSPYDFKYVYALVWEPIEKYLKGANQVYLAPVGMLHTVSFSAIKTGKRYLGDKYIISNLLSTKDIITLKEKPVSGTSKKAVLFGGADFGFASRKSTEGEIFRGQGFDYLPGSKKEVETIAELLSQSQWDTSVYVDTNATKAHFKSCTYEDAPKLLHISTHGFYFSKSDNRFMSSNIYAYADDPMMRTGLVFAGANKTWTGNGADINDGIVTAYEIANMMLTNTDLAVLSACETGMGDIVGNEGVYGLQRALRLAGVKTVMVSLWKIPDKETSEFMNKFYALWTKGMPAKDAMHESRQAMKRIYPNDPLKWAGFVLIE